VGAGRSQEAEYTLRGDLPAGEWKLAGDGIILEGVDVHFEIFVRRADTTEVPIVEWQHRFERLPQGFMAQAYDAEAEGPAVTFVEGDQLIFRYSGAGSVSTMAYQPNGDGDRAGGRIPFITLP
jgi:hypothetical protein